MVTAVCLLILPLLYSSSSFFFKSKYVFSVHCCRLPCRGPTIPGEDMQKCRGVLVCHFAVDTPESFKSHVAIARTLISLAWQDIFEKCQCSWTRSSFLSTDDLIKHDFGVTIMLLLLLFPNCTRCTSPGESVIYQPVKSILRVLLKIQKYLTIGLKPSLYITWPFLVVGGVSVGLCLFYVFSECQRSRAIQTELVNNMNMWLNTAERGM